MLKPCLGVGLVLGCVMSVLTVFIFPLYNTRPKTGLWSATLAELHNEQK